MNIRKIAILSILIFMASFLSACKTESLNSPEKLLDLPIFDERNKNIYVDLKKLTPADTDFILPQNAKDVGKINFVDLNNDGMNELVVFKKKESDNPNLGSVYMHIFKTDNESIADDTNKIVRISGSSIKYANFIDLNNDEKKEMILQVSNKGFENIYIYEYSEDTVNKIGEYTTSGKSIRLNYFDYDSDGDEECLALVQNLSTYETTIAEMTFDYGNIVFEESGISKNVDNIENTSIFNGLVGDGVRGSIVLYQSITGSSNTQIIIYSNGKFVKSLVDTDDKLKNPIVLMASDINDDNILEIPKIEFKYSNNTTSESRVVSWYTWNGVVGKDSSLKLAHQIFYSYDYNFKIVIPESINEAFYIRQIYEDNRSIFEFYSKVGLKNQVRLFDIVIEPKETDEYENKVKSSKDVILHETEGYIYHVTNINRANMKKYNLNLDSIQEAFYQINR